MGRIRYVSGNTKPFYSPDKASIYLYISKYIYKYLYTYTHTHSYIYVCIYSKYTLIGRQVGPWYYRGKLNLRSSGECLEAIADAVTQFSITEDQKSKILPAASQSTT